MRSATMTHMRSTVAWHDLEELRSKQLPQVADG
jgi:hypothetical protein